MKCELPASFASLMNSTANTNETHLIVCREIYEFMFSLPNEAKRKNPIPQAIELFDPTLLEIPVNRCGEIRDKLSLLSKTVQPKRVVGKLRKVIGWVVFIWDLLRTLRAQPDRTFAGGGQITRDRAA